MDLEEIIASFMSLCAYLGLLSVRRSLSSKFGPLKSHAPLRSFSPYGSYMLSRHAHRLARTPRTNQSHRLPQSPSTPQSSILHRRRLLRRLLKDAGSLSLPAYSDLKRLAWTVPARAPRSSPRSHPPQPPQTHSAACGVPAPTPSPIFPLPTRPS
jgi:hypothetical protein